MWRETLVFVAILPCFLAAVAFGPFEAKPDKYKDTEGCYIGELDTVIPLKESLPSKKECLEYSCGMKFVAYSSCGLGVAVPPCELVEDKEKPYPDCCSRLECPEDATA